MEISSLLGQLFPEGHDVVTDDWLVSGSAKLGGKTVAVLGTTNHAYVGSSNGLSMCHRYRLGGVRAEARAGFPSVFGKSLPLFRTVSAEHGRAAARVHVFFTLLEICEDTTLLKRGGEEGRQFAQSEAHHFLQDGGVRQAGWIERATSIHHAFVQRNLTAGGAADLLAATIFADSISKPS